MENKKRKKKEEYIIDYKSSSGNFFNGISNGNQIIGQENINREVARREEEWRRNQSSSFSLTAIGPIQIPMYDVDGNQIIGQENINREVARREEEWRTAKETQQMEAFTQQRVLNGATETIIFKRPSPWKNIR